ncbi:MAG: metallophosphoesterase family protein [Verrucomicrobia bacterium]|nr:metallophosphoesterase family protein [Verrucomicrobiota bacterium]
MTALRSLTWIALGCLVARGADQPERLILNLTAQPATSIAITWRTSGPHPDARVEIAVATDTAEFAQQARTVPARSEVFAPDRGAPVHHHSALLDGLTPATRYAYRVGHAKEWSEWNQFETAAAATAPFRFVWFGDPQDNIAEHCSRTFREAARAAGDARLWLFSGDLCSEPEDGRWGELFQAAGFVFRQVPVLMTPGNHDLAYLRKDGAIVLDEKGKKKRGREVSAIWRAHLTLPENGPPGEAETSYLVDYQGVRFVLINSNAPLEAKAAWLDRVLTENRQPWSIVAFHHPLYSSGRTRDDKATRAAFEPIFDRHAVDLVLTGHDHAYARSHKLQAGKIVPAAARGTVYVVSSSGPKTYAAQPLYHHLMAKTGEGLMLFHPITVDGRTLRFEARTAAGNLHDAFTLTK